MIGILVFPDFQLLDAAGPISVFEIANRYAHGAPSIRIVAVAPGPVRSTSGVEIVAQGMRRSNAITTLRSEEHTSEPSHYGLSRMPSSA